MKHIYCALALAILAAPLQAQQQPTRAAGNEFLGLDLEELLTLKLDPNLASVLESHIHRAGEWMLSYRHMVMDMTGRDLSVGEVLDAFMVAPTSMSMQMDMVSGMYAPTDRLTLMLMLPYKRLSMDHITRMGMTFTTRSSGIGDLAVMGNFVIGESGAKRLILQGGVMLPTGSIDERDATPAGPNQKLPYPMQLGSGTYDLVPGITYQYVADRWAWGTGLRSTIRLGKNSNDYRLGNRLSLSGWAGYAWTPAISNVLKIEGHHSDRIHGADPDLNPMMVPTADPKRFGGRSVDLHLITEFYRMDGLFEGLRMSLDLAVPAYESQDPNQLDTDWSLTGTVQWTF